MFSLCRLCATCTEPTELLTEIMDLEPRLTYCCGWRPSENEVNMPKKVCNLCVDEVKRSWDFVQCVQEAEKHLNKLLREQCQTSSEEIEPEILEVKIEEKKLEPSESHELQELIDDKNQDNDDDDDFDYFKDEFDDGEIFGEPIDYSDDEVSQSNKDSSPKKIAKKLAEKKQLMNDPFLSVLDNEDCLNGGSISSNGVEKLEKIYPEMKTMSWEDCQYKCQKCDKIFKGSLNFYTHIRSIHIEEVLSIIVPCFYCDSKYRREYALNRHIATEHFTHLKFRCPYCPDYYWNTRKLSKHRNMHIDVEYKCELCSQIFLNRDNFYAHCTSHLVKRKADPQEKFICDICKKHFKTKGSIRNHMLLHTDKFDHVCEQCGWKFQSKGNLKGHLASTHATVKPFKCEHCGKSFKTKHQLKNHFLIHNENYRPFTCTVCNATFRRKSTLTVHMRSHTNFCPYTCKFCGKSFRHSMTLQTHERSHTNDKPYICTHCDYRCTSKGNLNKHMMRAHSIDFRNHIVNPNN